MNKHNFNSIDKIKTPDNWKKKALQIPCSHIVKPETVNKSFSRIAVALCTTTLCLICTVLFFSMDNKSPIITKVNPTLNNSSYTETKDGSQTNDTNNELGILPTNSTENRSVNQMPTNPTEKSNNKPTQKPSVEPIGPTQKPTSKPAEKPTDSPVETPTDAPTQKPTNAPTEIPTTPPIEIPSDPPTDIPTSSSNVKTVIFNGSKSSGWNSVQSVDVFCKVFDSNGVLLGTDRVFSEQRRAEYLGEVNNVCYYRYDATAKGLIFYEGYYTYVFYDAFGATLCSGTQYVS